MFKPIAPTMQYRLINAEEVAHADGRMCSAASYKIVRKSQVSSVVSALGLACKRKERSLQCRRPGSTSRRESQWIPKSTFVSFPNTAATYIKRLLHAWIFCSVPEMVMVPEQDEAIGSPLRGIVLHPSLDIANGA